jgi:hypothetical protein
MRRPRTFLVVADDSDYFLFLSTTLHRKFPNAVVQTCRDSEIAGQVAQSQRLDAISPRPMLFITGDTAHSREFSEEAYKLAAEPKQLVIVPDAGHVDRYDRVEVIPFDSLAAFFREHLPETTRGLISASGLSR